MSTSIPSCMIASILQNPRFGPARFKFQNPRWASRVVAEVPGTDDTTKSELVYADKGPPQIDRVEKEECEHSRAQTPDENRVLASSRTDEKKRCRLTGNKNTLDLKFKMASLGCLWGRCRDRGRMVASSRSLMCECDDARLGGWMGIDHARAWTPLHPSLHQPRVDPPELPSSPFLIRFT